ncbi:MULTISPECIES: hypothetical protein [Halomonas]|uniref:hypothetical protein n=1 Tax=Halomonas TaxID=2745 RepID=UPI00186777E4|nr:hypothetical protein [Halomonas citrativorans]
MLGEVVQGVLVVLKDDAVRSAFMDVRNTGNSGVVQVERWQVVSRYGDKAEAACRYDVLM